MATYQLCGMDGGHRKSHLVCPVINSPNIKVNPAFTFLKVLSLVFLSIFPVLADISIPYPPVTLRTASPGHTTYYVDPATGDDSNPGLTADHAWRSFKQVNARIFAPGDRLIISPGSFQETLMPLGAGTSTDPVEIYFGPGRYDFFPTNALKLKLNISNDNDDPGTPKAIAMLFQETRHFRVSGNQTDIYIHGKMIEAMVDHAADIRFTGLALDYHRPTVSEFTVLQVATNYADVQVQCDATYTIENSRLVWVGEGWRSSGLGLSQECDPAAGRLWRCGSPLKTVTRVQELAPFRLRLWYDRNPGFTAGHVFQFRETFRDYCGWFIRRCQDVTWQNCAFHFLHGLGIVSQFSENLTFDQVAIAPRPGSGRTCAGWADMLHFSGCRGQITVTGCDFSGSNDDPINVHGIHLRITGQPAPDQLLVRFMHPQTYGIEAFTPGDDIAIVSHLSLCAYATNRVKTVEVKDDREILLTVDRPILPPIASQDVVENLTWTPAVTIRACRVALDSCRGFLISTRRPVLVESNTFVKTHMSAILIADDANSWFESGPVRDVCIRGNRFIQCAAPVIAIAPENRTDDPAQPVHENIRIQDNQFELTDGPVISARSTRGLTITGNRYAPSVFLVETNACTGIILRDNRPDH